MKIKLLWQFEPITSFLIASGGMGFMLFIMAQLDPARRDLSPLLMIVVGVLVFAFLTRLPFGKAIHRLFLEGMHALASTILVALGFVWFGWFNPESTASVLTESTILSLLGGLAAFSHVAVRLFARPYAVWGKMRRRRLMWEITHAQLRLVLFTMLILFGLMLIFNFGINPNLLGSESAALVTILTLFIAFGGFFGIVTGILLFVVIIPASVISYLTARQITQRVDHLIQVTRTIHNTNISARVAVTGEDEIALLAADFNTMLDRLEAARRDLESERDTVRDLLDSRRRLFANVSHELRTPIATIRAYLDALKDSDANAEHVAIIEREILRLGHLVDDVFALARTDIDGLSYTMRPLEIGAVLERTTATMRQQAWKAKKIAVVLDYQPQIPLVLVDEERLEQVMYNLLRNAVRHTLPGGLILVRACIEVDRVRVEVQDTGSGIAPEDLPHIWERFYRAAETRIADMDGVGLGLALVREMVTAMGGTVGVTSEPGRGSCFFINLRRVA